MNLGNLKPYMVLIPLILTVSDCKGQNHNTKPPSTTQSVVANSATVIDSLLIDLDSDGDKDKIEIIEFPQKQANRLLQIKMKENGYYSLFASNDSLIACGTCGYQSTDPFNYIAKIQDGFVLHFWFIDEYFKYKDSAIYLEKVEISRRKMTPQGIKGKTLTYTADDFGKVPLSKVGIHLKMLPEEK